MSDSSPTLPPKPAWRRRLLSAIRLAIFVAVAVGIVWAVRRSLAEFERQAFDWRQLKPVWLLAAMGSYTAGMLACWWYWHLTLWSLGQRPHWLESLRAFFLGQLGKYVPGKATVVALRADWVQSERTRFSVAAASVFIETLTMMAVGAWVASTFLIFWQPPSGVALPLSPLALRGLAIGLTFLAGVPIIPALFRRIVVWLGVHKADPTIVDAVRGLDRKLLLRGVALNLVTWGCWGASLWWVLLSLPQVQPSLSELPLLTACTALAMVAGFLSLIPGGLGVRELVILSLLQPFGGAVAIVSAVVLRLTWLVSEVLLATILYGLPRPKRTHHSEA